MAPGEAVFIAFYSVAHGNKRTLMRVRLYLSDRFKRICPAVSRWRGLPLANECDILILRRWHVFDVPGRDQANHHSAETRQAGHAVRAQYEPGRRRRVDRPRVPRLPGSSGGARGRGCQGHLACVCSIGHAYSGESPHARQGRVQLEDVLWSAMSEVYQEIANLYREMSARVRADGVGGTADAYQRRPQACQRTCRRFSAADHWKKRWSRRGAHLRNDMPVEGPFAGCSVPRGFSAGRMRSSSPLIARSTLP